MCFLSVSYRVLVQTILLEGHGIVSQLLIGLPPPAPMMIPLDDERLIEHNFFEKRARSAGVQRQKAKANSRIMSKHESEQIYNG